MKRRSIRSLALLLILGLLAGCAQEQMPTTSSLAPDSMPPVSSSSLPDQNFSETPSSQSEKPVSSAYSVMSAGSVQQVDTSGIEKVNTAIRQDQEPKWELPWIYSIEDRYVFTGNIHPGVTVTRYDLDGQDAAVRLSFEMEVMDPEELTLSKDKMVFAPCNYDAETGFYFTTITLLDFAAEQVSALYTDSVAVYDVECAGLNENDFAFFYIDTQAMQRVMVYDDAAGCSVLYEAPFPQGEEDSERLFSICCAEENIYILVRRTTAGESRLHCLCMDREGQLLWDRALDVLEKYTDPDYSIDQITVCGKYLLIKFYSCGNLPQFAALRLDEDEIRALDIPKQYPCWELTSEPVDGRYFVFTLFPDHMNYLKGSYSSDIAIFDMVTEQWTLAKLLDNNNQEIGVSCSSDGQLIFCDRNVPIREEWFTADLNDIVAE